MRSNVVCVNDKVLSHGFLGVVVVVKGTH